MSFMSGLSQAFIEGGKDFIALAKYLGDKELEEKKLQSTNEYRQGMLQNQQGQLDLQRERNQGLFSHNKFMEQLKQKELTFKENQAKRQSILQEQNKQRADRLTQAKLNIYQKQQDNLELQKQLLLEKYKNANVSDKLELAKAGVKLFQDGIKTNLNLLKSYLTLDKSIMNFFQEGGDMTQGVSTIEDKIKQIKDDTQRQRAMGFFNDLIKNYEQYNYWKSIIGGQSINNKQNTVQSVPVNSSVKIPKTPQESFGGLFNNP